MDPIEKFLNWLSGIFISPPPRDERSPVEFVAEIAGRERIYSAAAAEVCSEEPPITLEVLGEIMPRLPLGKATKYHPFLCAALEEFEINTPSRMAAFLAQVAHESDEFRFMEEIWGPTEQQLKYENKPSLAQRLGNTQPGDGFRYKGRGPIQLTGRGNYRDYGEELDLKLEEFPEMAAEPGTGFRIAGLLWKKKKLNDLADRGTPEDFKEITRRINGGYNGLAHRERYWAKAKEVLKVIV